MVAQALFVIILLYILFVIGKKVYKNLSLLSRIKQEPDYYPHWSFFLGIFYNIRTYGYVGHKGVEGVRIFVRNLCFDPFSKTGLFFGWGGIFYPTVFVATSRTEVLKAILASKQRVDKGLIYEIIDLFGNGLISSDKIQWAKHRKILNPTFHQGMLQNFVPVLSQQSQKLISLLDEKTRNGPALIHDFTEITSDRVMAMLMETIMGTKEEDLDPEFRAAAERIDRLQIGRLQNPLKFIKMLYLLTAEGRSYHKDLNFIYAEARRLVNLRIETLKKDENENYTGRKLVLIDAMMREHLKDSKNVTIEHIVNEVITFLVAGWDTTTWTTTFLLQLVGENPRIQELIFQEIDSELDGVNDDHLLTIEDISKLKYLECVINETLRFNPLVLSHLRHLYEDLEVEIDGDKRVIPAGTDVIIDAEFIHRSPRYWKNPDRFIPERFLPENSEGRDPLSFLPFSYGPRNCIGKTFAMCEEKIILAQIFRKFKVTAVDPWDKINMDLSGIARRTKTPIKYIFEPRILKA